MDEPAVCGDDVGAEQVVAGEAVLAHQPADPTAERKSADARRRDQAAGRRQAVCCRLVVDVSPGRAAADERAPRGRVDANALQVSEVDHDAAVERREAGDAVAAAAHGDRQVVTPRETDRGDHVCRAAAADDRAPAGGSS